MRELTLRPEVQEFAQIMETRLRMNDYKGGWTECTDTYLLARLLEEMDELHQAIQNRGHSPRGIIAEAGDLANFAMMLADPRRKP